MAELLDVDAILDAQSSDGEADREGGEEGGGEYDDGGEDLDLRLEEKDAEDENESEAAPFIPNNTHGLHQWSSSSSSSPSLSQISSQVSSHIPIVSSTISFQF